MVWRGFRHTVCVRGLVSTGAGAVCQIRTRGTPMDNPRHGELRKQLAEGGVPTPVVLKVRFYVFIG